LKTPPQNLSDEALRAQRETIRRGLARANTAAAIILLVVIGLAAAAVWEGNRALRERARALQAERSGREELWKSYEGQARGVRASPYAGHRFESMEALKNAASIRPSLELRNDAIVSLTLADIQLRGKLPQEPAPAVAMDSGFERYAVADNQGRVQVRRRLDEELLLELPASTNAIEWIFGFSPNGRYLPVGYNSGETRVWDLMRREIVLTCRTWAFDRTLEFSLDSQRLIVAEAGGSIRLYELADPAVGRTIQTNLSWHRARFSPDGRLLAIFCETTNVVWIREVATGREVARLTHPGTVLGLAWDVEGSAVATGCIDHNVYLWRLDRPEEPLCAFAGHQSAVFDVAFHPDGHMLASSSWDGTMRLWDIATCQELVRLSGHGGNLQFARDGLWLGMGPTPNSGFISLYEVAQTRALRFLGEGAPVPSEPDTLKTSAIWEVNFNADERLLASAGKQGVRVWNLQQGRQLARLTAKQAFSAFFHPDGEHLVASGDEGLLRWRIQREDDGRGVVFSSLEKLTVEDGCDHASVDRTGTLLAYGHAGGIRVLGRNQPLTGWPAFQWVAVSPDGRWIAASAFTANASVRLWEAVTGTLVREFPTRGPADIAFSPDNHWLLTGSPGEYCFWDVNSRELKHRLPRPDTVNFQGMIAFSPDRQMVAVVRSITQVQLLNSGTLEELARLESPVPQLISWLAFSPSGNQLAVATETPFIQVWDLGWLRQQLSSLGLDWGARASPPANRDLLPDRPVLASVSPAADSIGSRHRQFLAATAGGVLLAICLAIFVLRRHQRLVIGYQRLDDLAMERGHELQAAHHELLHSQKMTALGTLAAGIAHDFNNLLSIIRLSNDLIGRETRGRADVQEEVASVENAVQQGKAVVRSMLGYSREKSEKPAAYPVAEVIAETVSLLSKEFLSGIVLTLDVDKDAPPVWGMRSRLEQLILNLIVNAAEAMKGQGKLFISAHAGTQITPQRVVLQPVACSAYVEICVSDSGPGIDPQILPRIFEPFFTTKVVGTTRGTGLGLSLVYTIAQQDGVGLAVDTAVGHGTAFWIMIPANTGGGAYEV
jgi:signal transduction histidine kinase